MQTPRKKATGDGGQAWRYVGTTTGPQGLPAAARSSERNVGHILSLSWKKELPLPTPWLWASGLPVKEQISAALSLNVHSHLFQQPQDINTRPKSVACPACHRSKQVTWPTTESRGRKNMLNPCEALPGCVYRGSGKQDENLISYT